MVREYNLMPQRHSRGKRIQPDVTTPGHQMSDMTACFVEVDCSVVLQKHAKNQI